MSKGWLEAIASAPLLQEQIEIVGLVDIDESLASALGEEFGLSACVGADLGKVLAETDADLLFDIVPPAARRSTVLAGLTAGCHVLSEKPLGVNLADAREMIAAAERAGKVHGIIQNRRFNAGVRRIRALLQSGAIGELTGLHCDFFLAPHFGGFREAMNNVLLLDMAVHTFDAARFMADRTPLAVYAHEANPRRSWYAHGAAANAIFEFSDDVVFTYRGSWVADGAPTSWEGSWRFVGTQGSIIWDGADHFDARVVATEGKFLNDLRPLTLPPAPDAAQTHGHASVMADFISAISEGRQPETASKDNIKSLAMVFAAIESARTRARVEVQI